MVKLLIIHKLFKLPKLLKMESLGGLIGMGGGLVVLDG